LTAVTARITTPPGIYSLEGFLERPTCELIKAEMRAGEHARARVYDREWNYLERATLRSTLQVEVGDTVNVLVRAKLLEMREALGRHFDVELSDCQGPTYLIYKPGDFFEPHRDYTGNQNAPDHVRRRRVSAVVFLGDESAGEVDGEYGGGSLAFYGLLKDPRCRHVGIPVRGKAGMLVAFRPDVFHQVSPVTKGERFTIVSWFF